jgi:shikimate dehydrogenase
MAEPFCVIGDPIGHSISPPIHKAAFQFLNVDAEYEAVRVRPDELKYFVQLSRESGRPGWNVTIPHKETIMPLLDEIDPAARNIGAVNTIHNENGKLIGYNTDVFGCMTALKRAGFESTGKAVMLGAGGAARAGLEAIARLGLSECALYDIAPERVEKLKAHFQPLHRMKILAGQWNNLPDNIADADLIINASPVGMWPNVNNTPLPCPECIRKDATAFDMVYTPLETRFLREAKASGAQTVSGLVMLVAQALEADAIFFKRDLPNGIFEHVFEVALELMKQ